jgi:hypothetical protein
MECRDLIENALTARALENAGTVTGPAGWRCRKGKYALPAIRMAVGNARTVEGWAASMPLEILQLTNCK